MRIYNTVIIGGGPAGLMAANIFEKYHHDYVLLEKNDTCGKKLLLTGGKRCNVTNRLSTKLFIDTLTFKHKKFLYHALNTFGSNDVIDFFDACGLQLVLENDFKYFPKTEKSRSVLDALLLNIKSSNIHYKQSVQHIIKIDDGYEVKTKDEIYHAKQVIVAVGSNSFPTTGSSGDGLVFAEKLGIAYHPFTPAETHVYSNQVKTELGHLQGVSLKQIEVSIQDTKIKYQGDLIVTHFGLSGPVIMHLSEFIDQKIRQDQNAILNLNIVHQTADDMIEYFKANTHLTLKKVLDRFLVKRLVEHFTIGLPEVKIAEIKQKILMDLAAQLTSYQIKIDRVEDKEKAYVNKGGIDVKTLNPQSMENKQYKGLYFVGETVDLHGPIGGYNITIALSTGRLAAESIVKK